MYKNNLWRGILQLFNSHSLIYLLINIDRLANAICGGHYRATVSARAGYFKLTKPSNLYWALLVKVIDETFRPYEGKGHCHNAYLWELGQNKKAGTVMYDYRRGNDIALGCLGVVVMLSCLVLAPVVYVWANFIK